MDRNNTDYRRLIEPYLQGKLSAEEEQAFEEAYLADESLLEEVMLAERLREGLARHGREAHAPESGRAKPRVRRLSVLASPVYAAAATVLLAFSLVTSTTLVVENRALRQDSGFASDRVPTRLLPLVNVRGNVSPNVIDTAAQDEWLVFLVYPGPEPYDSYRATLTRGDTDDTTEPVWRQAGLEPTIDGELALGLPSRALTSGDYEITIEGRMADWPADRFDEVTVTPLTVRAAE